MADSHRAVCFNARRGGRGERPAPSAGGVRAPVAARRDSTGNPPCACRGGGQAEKEACCGWLGLVTRFCSSLSARLRRGLVATSVWLCEPRSHGRNKEGGPLPGRRPSAAVPHRSASPALCPCGHAASFRRRASSFVRGAWSSAALLPAAVLCERAWCKRRAVRRACELCCPVAAAAAAAACAWQLS